ncbi:MAG: glycosyltransferase family 4 protein [Lentisphaeria bacterium]|nr:glycosyltransferase family 4 protein [Lentisphaeria bacterium]
MSHIGIFTAYYPHVELGQEGIGRLLVFIMKGMLNNGHELTILAPSWHRKEVRKLLKEHSLEKTIKIKSVKLHPPIMVLIYEFLYWLKNRHPDIEDEKDYEDDEEKEKFTIIGAYKKFVFARLSSYSLPFFLLYAVIIGAIYLILFPLLLIIAPFWLLKKWYAYDYDPESSLGRAKSYIKEKLNRYLSFVPRNLRSDAIALGIMDAARSTEIKKMVRFVNKGDIDYWYVPSVFWKECLKIRKKRVIVVPDLVYAEFPQCYYSNPTVLKDVSNIELFFKKKPWMICYSNHVKNRHLIQLRNVSPKMITVIPHGVVDLSEHLKMGLPPKEIIEVYLRRKSYAVPNIDFVKKYNFAEGRYIIYTSQCRYHKNVIGLLHVLEILLRREHININLVLTCSNYGQLMPFLEKMNLTREVIFMPHVPENVLAALNALALLHVNPTLFEGGFPFTFGEAYSVGTPSVMSDIPVTREYVDDELAEKMLFDPYDYEDFAAKVKWALEHREELLALEKPLYEKFAQRSWDTVADEYYKAMRCSYRRKLPKRKRKPWKRSKPS